MDTCRPKTLDCFSKDNVSAFEEVTHLKDVKTTKTPFPTKRDVERLLQRYNSYTDPNEMVAICDWSGGCWKTLFEGIITDKAREYGEDPWDVFSALLVNLFMR